jgi:hypothetical protein
MTSIVLSLLFAFFHLHFLEMEARGELMELVER